MIQIFNSLTGNTILEIETLQGADLRNANLRYAALCGADLQGADLRGADLRGANLLNANLQGADLRDANLLGAALLVANLRGADLRGTNLCNVDLLGADLEDVKWPLDLTPLSKEQEEKNLRLVASLALSDSALKMNRVHSCNTTHCIAGWACHALPGGEALEKKYNWWIVGFHLLGSEASKMFHSSDDAARSFLEQYLVDPVDA